MRVLIALLGVLLLTICQATPLSGEHDPKDPWWSLGFTEPYYMKVWVENSAVEDITGKLFRRTGAGNAAGGEPEDGMESARGWGGGIGGATRGVVGADLPQRIYVRWQSLVEPQTYKVWVDIPEEARQLMHASTRRRCPETPQKEARYTASVTLGLAPGGIVQVWVRDSCSNAIKVAHAVAEIEPLGPSQGLTEGRYAHKTSENTQRYIKKYGIPYGSW